MIKKIIDFLLSLFGGSENKEPPHVALWISKEQFQKAAQLTPEQTEKWYSPVRDACLYYAINTPERIAAFIAQVGHESGGFKYVRELWGPTAAQQRYEGRADLGNTQPGDGSRFRGRGLIQITGRSNYEQVSDALSIDFMNNPHELETPVNAAKSAAWYWSTRGCNALADAGKFDAVTRKINGGTNGMADRLARWDVAKKALGVTQ